MFSSPPSPTSYLLTNISASPLLTTWSLKTLFITSSPQPLDLSLFLCFFRACLHLPLLTHAHTPTHPPKILMLKMETVMFDEILENL
jgi:hypothetical protein